MSHNTFSLSFHQIYLHRIVIIDVLEIPTRRFTGAYARSGPHTPTSFADATVARAEIQGFPFGGREVQPDGHNPPAGRDDSATRGNARNKQ